MNTSHPPRSDPMHTRNHGPSPRSSAPEAGGSLPGAAVTAPARRSPWPIAIAIGLSIVVLTNAAFIYIAVSGADPVAQSYRVEQR
jgi:hypothetical protein